MKKTMTRILTFALMAVLAFLLKLPAQASDITAFAPVFNASYYLEANPDLKAVLGNDATLLYHHFLTSGMSEGRQGSAEFNVHIYKENNADLKAVFGEDLKAYYLHYINAGKAEGRIASGTVVSTTKPTSQASSIPTIAAPTNAVYNPSNSSALSPLAPKTAESPKAYKKYWTWTASNGYQLKIKFDPNKIQYYMKAATPDRKIREIPVTAIKAPENLKPHNIIYDQTLNYRPDPNNVFLWAYIEFTEGLNSGYSSKIENFFIPASGLPLVEMPKSKLTAGVSTSSWEAFRKGFSDLWRQQVYNNSYARFAPPELKLMQHSSDTPIGKIIGISALNDAARSNAIDFRLEYLDKEKCWRLQVKFNEIDVPTELMWSGIRNCIRLVTPDAELIYQQIYEHMYGGNHVFPAYNTWAPIGNSQIKVNQPEFYGGPEETRSIYYYFK